MCEKKQNPYEQATGMAQAGMLEEIRFRPLNESNSIHNASLLVIMMLEMHAYPEKRGMYLYGQLQPAQAEIIEHLKRCKIIVPAATALHGSQLWTVDEDALRVYANAVCRVRLPEHIWKI
jgi:hypothetical protein